MATSSLGATAKIYAFPTKTRGATTYRKETAEVMALPGGMLPLVEFGSGWYHDTAISDDTSRQN